MYRKSEHTREYDLEYYERRYYNKLKDDYYNFKISDSIYCCPFCYNEDYSLTDLLRHASRIAGNSRKTVKDMVKHYALKMYIKRYKFDDERVTKEDNKRALEEQYGGEVELPQTNPGFNNPPFKFTKYSYDYMLVYLRESDKDKIICNVDEEDIVEHLRERLKNEQEEKEHKKKEEAQEISNLRDALHTMQIQAEESSKSVRQHRKPFKKHL
jgi:hypothetical protein